MIQIREVWYKGVLVSRTETDDGKPSQEDVKKSVEYMKMQGLI